MVRAVIEIIIGLFIWKIVPGWIEFGSKSTRNFAKVCFNIIGVVVVIAGVLALVRSLGVPLNF